MADESSEAVGEIDLDAVDALRDLRERQQVLQGRLEKIEEKRDQVSPAVYSRVRTDYEGQYRSLSDEAIPLEQSARSEAKRLDEILEQRRSQVEQIRLDEEEVVLRHDLGELDDETFAQSRDQLHERLAGHQSDLEAAEALRERFREVLPADEPSAPEDLSGSGALDLESADEEPLADEPLADEPLTEEPLAEEPLAEEPVLGEPLAGDPVVEEPVAEEPLGGTDAAPQTEESADDARDASAAEASSPDLSGQQVAALADAGPDESSDAVAAPQVRLGAHTEPMPLVFATAPDAGEAKADEELDDEEETGAMMGVAFDDEADPVSEESSEGRSGTSPETEPGSETEPGPETHPGTETRDVLGIPAPPAFDAQPLSLDEPAAPSPFDAPSLEAQPLEAQPLEAQPLGAAPLEAAPLGSASPFEAPPLAPPPLPAPGGDSESLGLDAETASPAAGATEPSAEMATRLMSAEELAAESAPVAGDGATRIAPVASLVHHTDMGEEQRFPLRFEPMTIGRTQDNDICVPGLTVSRRHAQVEMGENGFRVLDLGSENGIFVNGRQVTQHDLAPGDRIELGSAEKTLVFEIG